MKAVRVVDGQSTLLDVPRPGGDGVLVRVASASICGSDLHRLDPDWLGEYTMGHEFAGTTPDGTADSLLESVRRLRPMGRIGLLGSFWEPTPLDALFSLREIELIPAATYSCRSPRRNVDEAGRLLGARPEIAYTLITHRFPLEAVSEAFTTARTRSQGAITVAFDVAWGALKLEAEPEAVMKENRYDCCVG